MIDPGHGIRNAFDRRHGWQRRPAQHDHLDTKRASSDDLAVGGSTAAVLGNHDFAAMSGEQRTLVGLRERTAGDNVTGARHRQRRHDRLDAADQIVVLRGSGEGGNLLAADRKKHAARCRPKRSNCILDAACVGPPVSGDGCPGRPAQRQQKDTGAFRGFDGMCRNDCGVRMGGVDQQVDVFGGKVRREAVGPAKTADAHRHRLSGWRGRAAGEREDDGKVAPPGKLRRQLPCFDRAPEYENMSHVAG